MTQSGTTSSSGVGAIGTLLGSVADGQTYRNVLYLLLAFPLGLAYFILVILGFSLGLGLSVLLVGFGILFGTVIALRSIAAFERTLANALLGTDIAAPKDVEKRGPGLLDTATAYVRASSTWRSLGFVLLKFWLGVASFVLLVTFLGTAIELALLPIYPEGALNVQVFGWKAADTFQTSTQRLLAVPLGIALLVVALPILNAFARVNASAAESLLGPNEAAAADALEQRRE